MANSPLAQLLTDNLKAKPAVLFTRASPTPSRPFSRYPGHCCRPSMVGFCKHPFPTLKQF
eukprot:scaffold387_cov31-Tisochrysis_lutea.AAC.5